MGKFAFGFSLGAFAGFVAFPISAVALLVYVDEHADTLKAGLDKAQQTIDDLVKDEDIKKEPSSE